MQPGFSSYYHEPREYSSCKSPDRRKEIPCRIELPLSLSRPPLPQPFPELRKPHPSRRFRQQLRPMPAISPRFIITGIITDTTRTITITTAITITIIIVTSDRAPRTWGPAQPTGGRQRGLAFGRKRVDLSCL